LRRGYYMTAHDTDIGDSVTHRPAVSHCAPCGSSSTPPRSLWLFIPTTSMTAKVSQQTTSSTNVAVGLPSFLLPCPFLRIGY